MAGLAIQPGSESHLGPNRSPLFCAAGSGMDGRARGHFAGAAARACERFFAAALLVAFLLELLLQRPAGGGENAEQYRICVNQRIRAGQHARLCAVLKSARTGQRAMPGFVGATRSGAVQRVSPLNSMVP